MSGCYNCGKSGKESKELKHKCSIQIPEAEDSLLEGEFLITVNIGRDENHLYALLCKECLIKALEQGAITLKKMTNSDFDQIYY
jgi:hypothetical protein